MPGPRATHLVPLILAPGYLTNLTPRMETGRYVDGNRVRFHKGLPEKIGGWERIDLQDGDPPVSYIVLSGTNSGTENDLSWVASTGAYPIAGYRLYNADDDTLIIDTTSSSYAATGLSAGTYNYYAVSYDTQGNVSPHSNTVSLTVSVPLGGHFVLVGFDQIITSDDGTSFVSRSSGASNFFYGVSSSPDQVVTMSSAIPRVSFSSDTVTWTQATPSSTRDWRCAVWMSGLSKWVAGSRSSTAGNMMTSNDALTWAAVNGPSLCVNDLAYSPSQGRAVAALQTNLGLQTTSVGSSTDGTNWTFSTLTASGVWKGVCRSEEAIKFVLVGNADAGNPTTISFTSTTGVTWVQQTCQSGCWEGVCYSPELGLFCAVGCTVPADIAAGLAGGGSVTPLIQTSPDGVTWTLRTPATVPHDACLRAVAWSPSLGFMAVGEDLEFGQAVAMTSPDGINWTLQSAVSSMAQSFYDVTWTAI